MPPAHHHPHLCNEDHVLSAELLLQLPHQTHLNLLEGLQLRNGNEDDDGFPAASHLDFLNGEFKKIITT